MAKQAVIALDQGSSSSRALAIDSTGKVLARAQFKIKAFYPRAGWVEHDALDIARTQEKAFDAVLSKLPKSVEVVGVGLACQRSTVVLWDRETGKPAARAPSWQDGRAAGIIAPWQHRQAEVHELTGLYLTPYYSAPKIRWFFDNSREVLSLLERDRLMVGPVSSFLLWRLTKGEVFAADPTMAQRMMLLNLHSMDWDESLLDLFGVPRDVLPRVIPSAGDWGSVKRMGRTMPIRACLGDQQSAAIGLGGLELGSSIANYGTGAFFLHNTGTEQHRIPGLLTSVGWKVAGQAPCFLQEGTVHAAGASFDWLRENLGLLDGRDLDKVCAGSTQRLLALNAIGGLGAPRWDYTTKTTFFGLNSQTRPADLVRAVAEGIAYLISDIVEAMRAGGLRPGVARASGGLSRVDHLMQFQSDILGLELQRCAETEATALGVAELAAQAAGAGWARLLRSAPIDKVFKPTMPADESSRLRRNWKLFVDTQAKLSRELA
ncbi:MAG: glycerol kinase [Elusimicrobia bacterium]|nr:glycerol kinase [Elusimicrobiota bacterium]